MKAGRGLLTLVVTLAAAALCAPMAHAGSYDVLSCTIDGGYHANNAWVAQQHPGRRRRATSPTRRARSSGDPLTVTPRRRATPSPPAPTRACGSTPRRTRRSRTTRWSSTTTGTRRGNERARPRRRTTLVELRRHLLLSGTGQFTPGRSRTLADAESPTGTAIAVRISPGRPTPGLMTRDAERLEVARAAAHRRDVHDGLGRLLDGRRPAARWPPARERLPRSSTGSRVTITDNTAPALGAPTAGPGPAGARHALGRRAGDVQRDATTSASAAPRSST